MRGLLLYLAIHGTRCLDRCGPDNAWLCPRRQIARKFDCQFVSNDKYTDWHSRFRQEGDIEMAAWLLAAHQSHHVQYIFVPRGENGMFQERFWRSGMVTDQCGMITV